MNTLSPSYSPVIAYITEEVFRQGHNLLTLDGIERVGWMTEAWCYALEASRTVRPAICDAAYLGILMEPTCNSQGFRQCDVTVDGRPCPSSDRVMPQLTVLFEQSDTLTPLEFYKGFEDIHPFEDGNGRVHRWLFPPADGTGLDVSKVLAVINAWRFPI